MSNKIKVAINGFGRIGRNTLKTVLERPELEVVAINDPGEVTTSAHLFKYDSVYGIYPKKVSTKGQALVIDGQVIPVSQEREPEKLPWKKFGVDVVLECTGVFLTLDSAGKHLKAGAKKVIISAPAKDDKTPTYILGVNENNYKGEAIINMGSCTTNCVAPIMKVLVKNFGVVKSLLTTIHAYTSDQLLIDNKHKDLRRARSAAENIVPTTTGAATATAKVLPILKNNFEGMAFRVPVPVVSLTDFVIVTKKGTTPAKVNQALTEASKSKELKGILSVTNEPLVSSDFKGDPHSAIVDLPLTKVLGNDFVKVIAWYDNEWAYSKRLAEMVSVVASK